MHFSHRIKLLMKKNKYLGELADKISHTKLMTFRRENILGVRGAKKESPLFRACFEEHKADLEAVAGMMEDEFSRRTLQAVIEYRLSPRTSLLKAVETGPQYFMPDIFGPVENEVFVDGGAYDGKTILSLISEFGKGKDYYKKIYAWEPDGTNRKKLLENCKGHRDIEILPFGMWNKKATLSFQAIGDSTSRIIESGTESDTEKIQVDSIDNRCAGEKITFIKMDIEGSEIEALHGAEQVIRRDKPRLAICVYHKPEHLYEIPILIKEMVPEYKLYMRHHTGAAYETVLYAVCPPDVQ